MPCDPYDTVCDLIGRHVSAEETAPAAISIVAAFAALIDGIPTPARRAAARRSLTEAATWFNGTPAEINALIRDIATLDPTNRDRREAVLTAAWADLLVE